jgi:flagellar biosynthesis protein FlhG
VRRLPTSLDGVDAAGAVNAADSPPPSRAGAPESAAAAPWLDRCSLDEDVTARSHLRVVPGGRPRRGRIVAVTGGKGGIGKSTLALNLGLAGARRGDRTALVDTDLGAAGMSVLVGASTERGLRAVLDGTDVDELLIPTHGAWLLPGTLGGGDLRAAGDVGARRALAVIQALAERFDTVVVDVAAGAGDVQSALAAAADDVIVVVTPDPPSLAAAFACIERLVTRGVTRVLVLPNRGTPAQADEVTARLSSLAQRLLSQELVILPSVPADPDVDVSMLAALPIVVRNPDSPAARSLVRVRHALDRIAPSSHASSSLPGASQ